MKHRIRALTVAVAVLAVVAVPGASNADHLVREETPNIVQRGHSPHMSGPGPFDNITSDIAFWGNTAYQGNFNGFRIIDITDPDAPDELLWYNNCTGGQGDVMIWDDLLIRSWDSPAGATAVCGHMEDPENPGTQIPAPVTPGFEGLHVFDVSEAAADDPTSIPLIQSIEITDDTADTGGPEGGPVPGANGQGCGSHTATLVPDTANGRLLIYNGGSNGQCTGTEIIEIPLDDPTTHTWLRTKRLGRQCHDIAVFLGEVMRGVCAGGNGFSVFRMAPEPGDEHTVPVSLEKPMLTHNSGPIPDVTVGHTATFTADGERFVFGHEPSGGTQARCKEDDEDRFKMFFMYDTQSHEQVGKWFLPRPQTDTENCTLHNINFIPTTDGSDLLVSGNYQAGTWVTDWTIRRTRARSRSRIRLRSTRKTSYSVAHGRPTGTTATCTTRTSWMVSTSST